jgi:hypothetical protein
VWKSGWRWTAAGGVAWQVLGIRKRQRGDKEETKMKRVRVHGDAGRMKEKR